MAQVSPSEICGGQSGTGTGLFPNSLVLPCQHHFTMAHHTDKLSGGHSSETVSPHQCEQYEQCAEEAALKICGSLELIHILYYTLFRVIFILLK
jgi:hypothetical protein